MTSPLIKHATDATFDEVVIHADRPVIVDFYADWCGPCKALAVTMEKLAVKYEGAVDVVKVDGDANPGLTQRFGVRGIPVVEFFRPGVTERRSIVGPWPLGSLERAFSLPTYLEKPAGKAGGAAAEPEPEKERESVTA